MVSINSFHSRRWCWMLALLSGPVETFRLLAPHHQRRHHQPRNHQLSVMAGDELTKEDFTRRIYEVRDYYRQRPEQDKVKESDVVLSLLRTRLSELQLNRCYVGLSTIAGAGNGIFASRDIAKGELITLYPGDAVLIQDSTAEDMNTAPVGVMFGSHVEAINRSTDRFTCQEGRSYEMEINKYTSIVADPLMGSEDAAYLSHFINDGACLQGFDDVARELYSKETRAKCNAAHLVVEGAHMATVATAAIEKGREVFVSYGAGYWRSRSTNSETGGGVVVEIPAPIMPAAAQNDATSAGATSVGESRNGRQKKKKKKKKVTRVNDKKKGFGN